MMSAMDRTECRIDEQGAPTCSQCDGKVIETSRHASHIEERNGKKVDVDRVWGRCEHCNAERWWRTASQRGA